MTTTAKTSAVCSSVFEMSEELEESISEVDAELARLKNIEAALALALEGFTMSPFLRKYLESVYYRNEPA